MSFFDEQHYLDSVRSMEQMRVKEDAPLLSRPDTPERINKKLHNFKLADIPEVSPGPNAFAIEAKKKHNYQLNSNAFYQQKLMAGNDNPPTAVHPALRARSYSDPPTPPRESTCTTLSPFVNAGNPPENSPPLRLVPSEAHMAEPTGRAYIEERREQLMHDHSGSEEQRAPVFISTSTFEKKAETPKKRSEKQKEVTIAEPPPAKTPKRTLLEKLRLNTNFRGAASPSASMHGSFAEAEAETYVPVKAKAVLGTPPTKPKTKGRTSLGASSPSKPSIPRSPSKRRGLFSRKNSSYTESTRSKSALSGSYNEYDHAPTTASTVTKTPTTAFSDPSHYSYQDTRKVSTAHSDQATYCKEKEVGQCAVARSQSLKYFDHTIPPTPPSKDTPPDEKAKKEAEPAKKSSRLPFHGEESSPSKSPPEGVVSTNERLSPTRFGSYGHRETPTLVTRPSMYSLHASVVPTMTEPSTFEEMKARLDGLGLEGFSTPQENNRSPKANMVYSPSVYSTDWSAKPNRDLVLPTPPVQRHSNHQSDESQSTSKTVPIIYPELAKDPSLNNLRRQADAPQSRDRLEVKQPLHGRTHSRDHSPSPRNSTDSGLFARYVDDGMYEISYDSPYSHPSAAPSPLHYLPATTYQPSPLKNRKAPSKSRSENALGIQNYNPETNTTRTELTSAPNVQGRTSPQDSALGATHSDASNPGPDKLDRIVEMLNLLSGRNDELHTMRDEMRASNLRLDQRLAAMETLRASSPAPEDGEEQKIFSRRTRDESEVQQLRVVTQAAYEFYRPTPPDHPPAAAEEEEGGEFGTIAQLKEENRRLLEMVQGFAEKIQGLEGKKQKGGGPAAS